MSGDNRIYEAVNTTLVRAENDWGVSVAEKKVRKAWLNWALIALCVLTFFAASLMVIPVLAGAMLASDSRNLGVDAMIVFGCIALAMLFNAQSRKGPRNAIEVDHEASEVRIGAISRHGAFVRHQVLPLSAIDDVLVRDIKEGQPELAFISGAEHVTVALADAKLPRLENIAAQVLEAAQRARTAPRRSRIRSAIAGLGANYRELGNRAISRFH